jgi:predicted cupin superfamily sugar epimerase
VDHAVDDADRLVELLGLRPHPEGGRYAETWRAEVAADAPPGTRPAGSAIYFLLRSGEVSRWHRVDAAEAWHHYAGATLELRIATGRGDSPIDVHRWRRHRGRRATAGRRTDRCVAAARSLGAWLVGCTVAPAFEFAGFELAPEGWEPGQPE